MHEYINYLLGRQLDHGSRSNSSIGFNHLGGGKGPARSAGSLVFNIRDSSGISPVNRLRKVLIKT